MHTKFINYKLSLLLAVFLLFISIPVTRAAGATYYWVGAGGDFSNSANWANSSGGAGGAGIPDSTDTAIFDSNSGDATVDALYAGTIGTLTMDATYASVITQSRTLTINNGDFTLNGGTFEASATDTLTFNKGFNYSGGTFTHNNGTVEFTGGTEVIDLSTNTVAFYDFVVNRTSVEDLDTTAGDTISIENDLYLTDGDFDGSATVNVSGTIVHSANFDGSSGGSALVVNLVGSNVVTANLVTASNAYMTGLTVNNPNATVNVTGSDTLVFEGTLTVTQGEFDGASSTLTLGANYVEVNGASATFTGGDVNSYANLYATAGTVNFGASTTLSSFRTVGGYTSFGLAIAGTADVVVPDDGFLDIDYSIYLDTDATGSFTLPADNDAVDNDTGIVKVGRNFYLLQNPDSFIHNNGTIEFDGASTFVMDLAGNNVSFYNLIVNRTVSSDLDTTAGDTLTIEGALWLEDGDLDGTATINVTGYIDHQTTFDGSSGGSASTINLTGTAVSNSTLRIGGIMPGLVIDNPNAVVDISGSGTLTFDTVVTINAGVLDLNGNDIIGTTPTVNDGGTLRVEGSEDPSNFTLNVGSTVEFEKQDLVVDTVTIPTLDYYSIKISAANDAGEDDVYILDGNRTLDGDLTISSGVFATNSFNLTVTGTVSNEGTLRLVGNETLVLTNDSDSGTVEYVGDDDGVSDQFGIHEIDYYNLVINSTDTGVNADVFNPQSPSSLTNGLEGYWEFEEAAGPTAVDSSENGYDGTYVNSPAPSVDVPTVNFDNTRSLDFARADSDYVNLGASAANLDFTTEDFSLFVWAKPNGVNAGSIYGNRYNIDATDEGWVFGLGNNDANNQNLVFDINGDSDNLTTTSSATYTDGVWNHLGVVKEGNNATFYVNGTAIDTLSVGTSSTVIYDGADTSHYIGSVFASQAGSTAYDIPAKYFNGNLDELRIYSRVLNSGEISALAGGDNEYFASDVVTLNVDGSLQILEGTFNAPPTINLAGDFTLIDTATFNHNDGAFNLDGTDQTLIGDITFYDLTKTTAAAASLILTAGDTFTITNIATLQGASGNLLSLISDTPDSQANIDPQGTRNFEYLNVQDINNVNGTEAECLTGCTDSGNNTNWLLGITIEFTLTTDSTAEADTNVQIEISLSNTYGADISVDYALSGTATGGGADYTLADGTATVTSGLTTTDIDLVLHDDDIDEPTETVILTLSNPTAPVALGDNTVHTFSITDNDSAGITLTESDGDTAATEGGTDTYTVVLTSEPTDDVVVTITTDAQSESDVSELTFTALTWDDVQTVTLTATDDDVVEGAHTSTISHTVASDDLNYDAYVLADVEMNITDNDVAGITLTESDGDTAATEGGTDTYTVVLTSEPTDDVVVTITTDAQSESDVSELTFTALTWDDVQTVTLTATDDDVVEGAHTSTISHTVASDDPNYDAYVLADVEMNITDNDVENTSLPSGGSSSILLNTLNTPTLAADDEANPDPTGGGIDKSNDQQILFNFSDVEDHWAEDYIKELFEKGIVEGREEGKFYPAELITRAELTKIAVNGFELATDSQVLPFNDIDSSHWGYSYVVTAYNNGLLVGYPDGSFKPNEYINRVEALKILLEASFVNGKKLQLTADQRANFEFIDSDQWYNDYIIESLVLKIADMVSSDEAFRPGDKITRAEAAKFAALLID